MILSLLNLFNDKTEENISQGILMNIRILDLWRLVAKYLLLL